MQEEIDKHSSDMIKIVNSFNAINKNISMKGLSERLYFVNKILVASKEISNKVLNTTCGCENFDELTMLLDRYEKISETISYHAERMTKISKGSEIKGVSAPGVKEACDLTITKSMTGDPFYKSEIVSILKKAKRNAKPRKRDKGEGSDT